MPRNDTSVTGAAGAYLVAGELALRGWNASLTWGNAPRTDVLAESPAGSLVSIQVKAKRSGDFQIGRGGDHPMPPGSNEWFVLVALSEPGLRSEFFVVPRNHLVAAASLAKQAAGLNNSRNLLGSQEFLNYSERWDLLDLPASEAPALMPEWVADLAGDYDLPEGLNRADF